MECRPYIVLIAYVKSDKPLPAFVKKVRDLGGRVVGVNEELRRVLAGIPAGVELGRLKSLVSEYASSAVCEAKIHCSDVDPSCVREKLLKSMGARAHSGAYYLRLGDSDVAMAVVQGNSLVVRVGRGSLVIPPPPSLFYMTLDEAEASLSRVLGWVSEAVRECSL